MLEKNPMPIRKFSLIGIIGLSLILFSMIGELFNIQDPLFVNIQTYVVLISQIIGNILFGITLVGYFMHLKENKILKWTSLSIGIFYVLNFFSLNNLFTLFYDEFGLVEYFSSSPLFTIYSLLVSFAMIFFGYAISKLGKVNKLIALFSIIFIACSIYVTATNLVTTQLTGLLNELNIEFSEKMMKDILIKYQIFNILSYATLLVIFVILFINQKGIYTKTFKVKVESAPHE